MSRLAGEEHADDASPRNGVAPPKATRWKPGQSGNPRGTKPGTVRVTDRLRRLIEQNDGELAEALAKAATKAALKGDVRFWKEIVDRLDGPVKQEIEARLAYFKAIDKEAAEEV